MKKTYWATTLLLASGTLLSAQNPIISGQYSADPTARVFDGRLYVYPSHDIHPSNNPHPSQPNWFCMADYHVFSSENLTDWTDHGKILDQKDVPWGNPEAYSMWAPDCVKGKDGRYYFFFPNAPKEGRGFGVGVSISDTPYGPFKAEEKNLEGVTGIDPCVLQASNGKNYIFWGGGGIQVAELSDDLLSLSAETLANPKVISRTFPNGQTMEFKQYGRAITELPEGFKEGPFAFERNGKYYLTYPWVRGKAGDPGPDGKPLDNHTETLAYAMSDNPMGPYEFKGLIMAESPTGCWTNHHSIVEYKGQWYLFYHHNDYSPRFDKNRSVRVDSLNFNADGTIKQVIPTLRGVGITDARSMVQMDRYSTIGGGATIDYNDTVNYFNGWKVRLPKDGYVTYGNVQMPANNNYKVWVNVPGFWGRAQVKNIEETTLKLTCNKQDNGLTELVLTNTGNMPVEVDWLSLNDRQPLVPSTRGGMETGSYRNLFVEAGYAEADVEKKLQEVFNDVFYGPNKCYFEVGKDMAYISDVKNDDVRTEGMSYGMMIAVQFDRKDIFDKLWRWSKKYMQVQEGPMEGYFRWSCKRSGEANAEGPASDGELYFITSLIFASNQWGNNTGIDYLAEAQHILNCIQPRTVEQEVRWENGHMLDTPKKVMREIALIDPTTQLISFVPGMPFTDPSYHIPAFYEVWARYAEDGRESYWRECARKSREYLHASMHPLTGLNPDYNQFDGSMMQGPRGMGGMGAAFRYDSWRVPMNIALDYSWSCADRTWQQNYGHTIQNFFYSQGLETFVDQYNVDGTTPSHLIKAGNYHEKLRHSIGLVATTAAASLMCTHPKSYEFIDQLWNAKHQKDADGFIDVYYDGLLRLFAFMHLSGHYRSIERQMQFSSYFEPITAQSAEATPDANGFIRRWNLMDPIDKPNRSNTVFIDSYLREAFAAVQPLFGTYDKKGNFKPQKETEKQGLQWHALDSQRWNIKLFRFAACRDKQVYGVLFLGETVIECDEDITDVRLAAGSNSASMWWLNDEEVLLLSGDRRMVQDDGVSNKLTLKKGRNVLKCAVINGPGMSDFCVRFLDKEGKPVTNIRVKN